MYHVYLYITMNSWNKEFDSLFEKFSGTKHFTFWLIFSQSLIRFGYGWAIHFWLTNLLIMPIRLIQQMLQLWPECLPRSSLPITRLVSLFAGNGMMMRLTPRTKFRISGSKSSDELVWSWLSRRGYSPHRCHYRQLLGCATSRWPLPGKEDEISLM